MKQLYPTLLLLVTAALAGCKATDAMDSAIDMQKQMSGLTSSTQDMEGQTKKLNDDGIRLQKVGEGMKLMYDPEARKEFIPPPPEMLAGAKLVAENTTSTELIEFIYATIKYIDKVAPDDSKRDPATHNFPLAYATEYNHEIKHVNVGMLKAIAAQVPQAMVEQVIAEQIEGGGGRYEDAALAMLMLRAQFLQDFYISEGVFEGDVDNIGKLETAFQYVSNLEFIVDLPFASKIQFQSQGMLAPETDYNYQLDPNATKLFWKKIVKAVDNLPDNLKADNSPYARRISEIRATAQSYFDQHNK
jgi:hypothetical protein